MSIKAEPSAWQTWGYFKRFLLLAMFLHYRSRPWRKNNCRSNILQFPILMISSGSNWFWKITLQVVIEEPTNLRAAILLPLNLFYLIQTECPYLTSKKSRTGKDLRGFTNIYANCPSLFKYWIWDTIAWRIFGNSI